MATCCLVADFSLRTLPDPVTPDYVEVEGLLREVGAMFEPQAREKGLLLTVDIPEGLKEILLRVDRGRLKQAMVNLVSNAIKYTLVGEITIILKRSDDTAELSVLDSGVGMTDEERDKLFGKFYRVEADECKGVSGTGLGLWISKYIVEHMHGSISVESIKGKGSRFVLKFPIHVKSDV